MEQLWQGGGRLLAALGPLGLALWLVFHLPLRPLPIEDFPWPETSTLAAITAENAAELETIYVTMGYEWPPRTHIPAISMERLPPDIESLEVDRKKALFFRALLPMVEAENARIRAQRQFLLEQFARGQLRAGGRGWQSLESLAEEYRVPGDLNAPDVRELLLRRVDEVPAGLVLAQAAHESAWGNSRFARLANNLFGLWTYRADIGMVPLQRAEDASHFVRVFPDVRSSVRAYLHNINVGHAYVELRQLRARIRAEGRRLEPLELSEGLLRYSERGAEYVEDIRRMITVNGLDRIAALPLLAVTQ